MGGSDFDNILTDYFVEDFLKKHKGKITREDISERVLRRLRTQAERVKRVLSSSAQAAVEVDSLANGVDYNSTISRAKFEELCSTYFKDTLKVVDKVLLDAKMSKSQIHEVVLVGGSTRIPKIQQMIKDYFNGKELCKSINPDEAVAFGAAVQAAKLTGTAEGDADKMILIDVTPLSLGIETGANGVMTAIVERQSRIPCKKTQVFSTYRDYQNAVTIQVYEGERKFTKDNNKLDTFNLDGIPPALRGVPQIEVTFDINSDSILKVTAKDLGTKREQNVTISNNSKRLSKDDIDKMIEEAKKFEQQDKENLEKTQAKNTLEDTIYRVNQFFTDNADKLKEVDIEQTLIDEVKTYSNECKAFLETDSLLEKTEYESRNEKLNKLFEPVSKKLYENTSQSDQSKQTESKDNGDDLDEGYEKGTSMPSGMPNLSPEQMAQFQEIMGDPVKRAQMQDMAKKFMGGAGGSKTKTKSKKSGPSIEEVD